MIKKLRSKVTLKIEKIEGQGVDIQQTINGLQNMKTELEALGCKVHIEVEGQVLAGNGIRTHDILLGKNSVTVEGETAAYTNQFGLKLPEANPRICEHFEIPDDISCEYCLAYADCPLHFRSKSEVAI